MEVFVLITLLSASVASTLFDVSDRARASNVYFISLVFVCLLVAGLRDGTSMPDYATYTSYFTLVATGVTPFAVEPSFIGIARFSQLISTSPVTPFLIYALLGLSIKAIAIYRYSDYIFASLVVYISNYFILHEMIQIRVGVAAGIFLFSLRYLKDGDAFKYFLCIMMASFFHYSALSLLFIYFIRRRAWQDFLLYFSIPLAYLFSVFDMSAALFSNIFSLLGVEDVADKISDYEAVGYQRVDMLINVFSPWVVSRLIVFYFFLVNLRTLRLSSEYGTLLLAIYGLGISIYVALSSLPYIAVRLSQLLMVVEILLIPLVIMLIRQKVVARFFVVAYAITAFSTNYFFSTYFRWVAS